MDATSWTVSQILQHLRNASMLLEKEIPDEQEAAQQYREQDLDNLMLLMVDLYDGLANVDKRIKEPGANFEVELKPWKPQPMRRERTVVEVKDE